MPELVHWVSCILRDNNKILLLKRSSEANLFPHYWSFISGAIEENDTNDLEAIKREINEELGIDAEVEKVDEFELIQENRKSYLHLFAGKIEPNTQITLNSENTEFRWADPGELDSFKLVPGMKAILERKKHC